MMRVGHKSNMTVVLRRRCEDIQRHREESQVKTKAETEVMYLPVKKHQGLLITTRN